MQLGNNYHGIKIKSIDIIKKIEVKKEIQNETFSSNDLDEMGKQIKMDFN